MKKLVEILKKMGAQDIGILNANEGVHFTFKGEFITIRAEADYCVAGYSAELKVNVK